MFHEHPIETLKRGATDYVLKDRISRLIPSINRALNESHNRIKKRQIDHALRQTEEKYYTLFSNIFYFNINISFYWDYKIKKLCYYLKQK